MILACPCCFDFNRPLSSVEKVGLIRIPFTEEEIKALDDEPYHHPHPRVQQKMAALWLKSQRLSHGEISPLTSISANTLPAYLSQYLEGGIEALKIVNFGQHPAAAIKQAAARIKEVRR